MWPRLSLPAPVLSMVFWLAIFGAFAKWISTTISAAWRAGIMVPIVGGGRQGTPGQEGVINILLWFLSFAIWAVCIVVVWGLMGGRSRLDEHSTKPGS